jgi:hypothetical protein
MEVTYIWPPWLSGSYHPRSAEESLLAEGLLCLSNHLQTFGERQDFVGGLVAPKIQSWQASAEREPLDSRESVERLLQLRVVDGAGLADGAAARDPPRDSDPQELFLDNPRNIYCCRSRYKTFPRPR